MGYLLGLWMWGTQTLCHGPQKRGPILDYMFENTYPNVGRKRSFQWDKTAYYAGLSCKESGYAIRAQLTTAHTDAQNARPVLAGQFIHQERFDFAAQDAAQFTGAPMRGDTRALRPSVPRRG